MKSLRKMEAQNSAALAAMHDKKQRERMEDRSRALMVVGYSLAVVVFLSLMLVLLAIYRLLLQLDQRLLGKIADPQEDDGPEEDCRIESIAEIDEE